LVARSSRSARTIIAVGIALLAAYFVTWLQLGPVAIGRSDFTAFYAGSTLIREGHGAAAYDAAVQGALRNQLIAPDRAGAVPFDDAPTAAAIVVPFTLLSLDVAYRVWTLLLLAALLAAVVIAVRAAPWPAGTSDTWKAAAAVAALAGTGTWMMFVQGQWSAFTALGLALAYRDWRAGHQLRGGFLLVVAAGIAKPHLAIGLAAFVIGWRQRRVIAGALWGALALAVTSLLIVGPAGVGAWINGTVSQATRWDLRSMVSFIGIPGSLLGNGISAHVTAAIASLVACAAAWWLGSLARKDSSRLAATLAGAAVLSLVAAPHAYAQDLVMLAPALVWMAAWTSHDERAAARFTPLRVVAVFAVWSLISAFVFVDFLDGVAFPPGQLTAWALVIAASGACAMVWRRSDASREVTTTAAPLSEALRASPIR
jgi:glycosyl transferase family 87